MRFLLQLKDTLWDFKIRTFLKFHRILHVAYISSVSYERYIHHNKQEHLSFCLSRLIAAISGLWGLGRIHWTNGLFHQTWRLIELMHRSFIYLRCRRMTVSQLFIGLHDSFPSLSRRLVSRGLQALAAVSGGFGVCAVRSWHFEYIPLLYFITNALTNRHSEVRRRCATFEDATFRRCNSRKWKNR